MPSIRFVTQKPPTTFIAPKTTAIRPTAVVKRSLAAASAMIAPTSTTPWMALVALMSGVCKQVRDPRDELEPEKGRDDEDGELREQFLHDLTGLALFGRFLFPGS